MIIVINILLVLDFVTPTDEGLIEYQEIFKSHNITFGDMSELNGHKHFNFMDKTNKFLIFIQMNIMLVFN